MRIAIITGGETAEREISIKSAKNIKNLIDFAETEIFIFPEDKERFLNNSTDFNLVIPVIHGLGGEDGSLQETLGKINLPYIFSGVETNKIGIDKIKTKEIAQTIGIISPKEISTFPMFVKPQFGGSSVSSKLCTSQKELNKLIQNNPSVEMMEEEPIKGREFTIGIIEHNNQTLPLPIIEIIPKGLFFDFENKYNPKKLASEICPAEISEDLSRELQKQALKIHKYLKARHLSRSDFIVTPENKIYFLEINTIPGMTNTSLIPKMLREAKIPLQELLKEWCLQI